MNVKISQAVALGIDIGTSGARASAIDRAGNSVGFASAPFASPEEMRQPVCWWNRVAEAVERLAKTTELGSIEGVAVDGTSGTVLSLDRAGEPTGQVLMYNDPCPDAAIVDSIAKEASAGSTAVGANSGLARAIYLSRIDGAHSVVHQADWILMKLGCPGRVSDENNALKTGFDLEAERWPDWIEAAGMDVSKLPLVNRAGMKIAPVEGFLRKVGLANSAWYHAGTTDGCASFLATGASANGDAVTALGSTIVLKLASDAPITAPEYGVYSHRVGRFWLVGGASNSGGNVMRALIGDDRLDELTEKIDPSRKLGLDFYPLLRPGERFPINDPQYPPRLTPRPDDDSEFLQAILEGMTEIERLGYQRLRELGAPTLTSLRTVGGGARNHVWTSMRARAMGINTVAAKSVEAAVGTAALVLSRLDNTSA
ncbi:sugar (pentulose or hexulose) kinase [Rhizobium sp. BK650]|uniref:FGGY-family carbohydrate kinase n=1 Tax=Rhizobium sp. BK650 TaxID=2586990 RepID=UPI001619DFC8|nr:FGGY-family carbohydrate kinase [Rhizobium sp. BK650]MBB3660272.1 sugar (pentulose or hexulose) kinase [Rhizobium sp. BK650]